MDFKNDLNLAFKPKMLSSITGASFANALKSMASFFGFWLIIHVIIALINGAIDGKALGGVFFFSFLTGLSVAMLGIIGLLVVGLVSSYASKLFKGSGDLQKTIGLVSVGVLPIVIIGLIRDLLLLISTLGNHFLADAFSSVNIVLYILAIVWLAWLLTEAIALADKIKKFPALVCFVIGFIVAALINWPLNWVLVKIVTEILLKVI